ncbi:MAG: hypothetical protein AAF845_01980 [Bacteroidota bacterium]
MIRLVPLAALLLVGGCDYLREGCLYDEVGCALPGDWRLVSADGAAASGRWEIAEGFVDRSGYGVLPTGSERFPEMRGPFGSTYSLDEDSPQRFDLKLWSMPVDDGTVYVDLFGRVERIEGDRMEYTVLGIEAELIPRGGGSVSLSFPTIQRGTRLVFER